MSKDTNLLELTTIEVRRGTAEDRIALLRMYETFEPRGGPYGLPPRNAPEKWLKRLAEYPNFVATVDGHLVAHGVLCPEGDSAELAVFVHQDYRNRGLGKAILSQLIEEARHRGLKRVWGMMDPENIPLLRLALANGFIRGADPLQLVLDLK
jgi:GNAT superfamily N-acetyltransferase